MIQTVNHAIAEPEPRTCARCSEPLGALLGLLVTTDGRARVYCSRKCARPRCASCGRDASDGYWMGNLTKAESIGLLGRCGGLAPWCCRACFAAANSRTRPYEDWAPPAIKTRAERIKEAQDEFARMAKSPAQPGEEGR